MRSVFVLLMVVCLSVGVVSAQADTCPAGVVLALARANAACSDLARDSGCYGNGEILVSTIDPVQTLDFAAQGERIDLAGVRSLFVRQGQNSDYGVLKLSLQTNILETQPGRNVTLLAFGDAQLDNLIDPVPTVEAVATGSLNIRTEPDGTADIITTLPLRTSVVANGRDQSGTWLRVRVPGQGTLGWVSTEVARIEGDVLSLVVVDDQTPLLQPFQKMTLATGVNDALCEGVPASGVLVQTPNPDETTVAMTINGVDLQIRATVLVQAVPGETMTLKVLAGQIEVHMQGAVWYVPAGGQINIPLANDLTPADVPGDAVPLDDTGLAALPVNNLAYRIALPQTITESDIAKFIAAAMATPEPTPDPEEIVRQRCTRSLRQTITVWAGPGEFYEALRDMRFGQAVYPAIQAVDSAGTVWWQLNDGGWLRAAAVESSEACGEVPLVEVVPPPTYNHFIAETCESTNGPVRAGQRVEIEFTDGGWPTYEEALAAPRIDSGRILVNQQRIYISTSRPIEVAEDRWYRRFYGTWIAEPGTYRILAERLTYSLTCDLTVPVG